MKFYLVVLLLSLAGCGKDANEQTSPAFTEVVFQNPFGPPSLMTSKSIASLVSEGLSIQSFASQSLATGAMIYAVRQGGVTTDYQDTILLTGNSGRLALPNGQYRFYALGYTNTDMYLSSSIKCGSSDVVSLNGGETAVNITVSTSNCINQAQFAASRFIFSPPSQLGSLNIVSCSAGALPGSCGGGCVACLDGNAGSYVISLVGFKREGNNITEKTEAITSPCRSTLGTPGGFNVYLSLPYGLDRSTNDSPFRLAIDVYTPSGNTTCSGGPNRRYTFPDGAYDALTGPRNYGGGNAVLFENNNDGIGVLFLED